MNDLLSVFYTVFFWDYLKAENYEEVSDFDVDSLPEQVCFQKEVFCYPKTKRKKKKKKKKHGKLLF